MYELIKHLTDHPERLAVLRKWAGRIPKPLVYFLCFILSWLLYWAIPRLRKQIHFNMQDIFREHNISKTRKDCRSFYLNLCIILFEILFDTDQLNKEKDTRFKVNGLDHIDQALSHGRGAILFAPHMGNFFFYYWLLSQKYNCLTVATGGSKELRPLYLWFQELGCKGLDYDATPSLELMKALKKHLSQNGVVLLLGDFWRPTFPSARFFNRLTRSPAGAAMFALQQQVPIVPLCGYRSKGFSHYLQLSAPLYLYEELSRDQINEATNRLNSIMEKMIFDHPDQWFYWFNLHERWEVVQSEESTGGTTVA